MSIVAVVVVVAMVLGLAVLQKQRLARFAAANADKTLAAVAARLGMTVVEGDPNLNLLLFQQPAGDFERRIVLSGRPYGRATGFCVRDGRKTSDYLVVREIAFNFDCFLETQTNRPVPIFEVALRSPNPYLVPALDLVGRRPGLREISTGNPELDALFVVRAVDPRVGPALAPALALVRAHPYVHFAGEGTRVWSSITRLGLPYFAHAPHEVLLALESLACGIDGRPAPARVFTQAA